MVGQPHMGWLALGCLFLGSPATPPPGQEETSQAEMKGSLQGQPLKGAVQDQGIAFQQAMLPQARLQAAILAVLAVLQVAALQVLVAMLAMAMARVLVAMLAMAMARAS